MNGTEADQTSTTHATPPPAPGTGLATPSDEPAGGSSLDSERDLIGRLLTDPDNAATVNRTVLVCQETGLRAEDLFYTENRPIYSATMNLVARGATGGIAEVETELMSMGQLDQVGGSNNLRILARRISSSTPSAQDLVADIANKAIARRGVEQLAQLRRNLQASKGDAAATLRAGIETLGSIASRTQEPSRIRPMESAFGPSAVRMIDLRQRSALHASIVATGITELDYRGGGLMRRGKLTLLTGRPSIGKTTYAKQLFIHAGTSTTDRQPTAGFFLEGQLEDLTQRMIQLKAGKDHSNASETDGWRQAAQDLDAGRFFYEVGGRRAVEAISAAGPSFMERGVKLVIVDSYELLDAAGGALDEALAWSYILRTLKSLAQTYNVAVLLNRVISADTVEEAREKLDDSEGKIDIAALMHRIAPGPGGAERRQITVFHNRNGALVETYLEVAADRNGVLLPIDKPRMTL